MFYSTLHKCNCLIDDNTNLTMVCPSWQCHFFYAVLAVIKLGRVLTYKNGAPLDACNTMMPRHGLKSAPSKTFSPYSLRLFDQSGQPIIEYIPGSKKALRVEIQGPNFKGFLLSAKTLATNRRKGEFMAPLPSGAKYLPCDRHLPHSTVTHENNNLKQNVKFWWKAPKHDFGPLDFVATIVKSKTEFWTLVMSHAIYPSTKNLTADTSRCGNSFGCLQVGSSNCQTRSSCEYTFFWKCTRDSVVFELFGNYTKLKYIYGYSGLGFSKTDREVILCAVEKDSLPIIAKFYKNSSSKKLYRAVSSELVALKLANQNHRFLCRFEMVHPFSSLNSKQDSYQFFVHKGGRLSEENIVPLSNDPIDLCSNPHLFVEYFPAQAMGSTLQNHGYSISDGLMLIPMLLVMLAVLFNVNAITSHQLVI